MRIFLSFPIISTVYRYSTPHEMRLLGSTIISNGLMHSSLKLGCSRYKRPFRMRNTPDEETTDRRAVCEKTARAVRREGRHYAFPTPINCSETGLQRSEEGR